MRKNNIWCIILIVSSICFYSIYFRCQYNNRSIEMFETNGRISDELYVRFYEKVFSQNEAFVENIRKISNYIDDKSDLNILDIGTGAGRHYELLKNKYKTVTGIDKMPEFIKRSKIRNPDGTFITGDVVDPDLFKDNSFSHVTCFFDTIHHNTLESKKKIFTNIYNWLKPGGQLFINFMIKDKLDPAPRDFSRYFYDEHKVKHSLTYFENLSHDAWWTDTTYHEQYINKDGKSFLKIHKFHIEKTDELFILLKNSGFKLTDALDYDNFDINDMVLCIATKQ